MRSLIDVAPPLERVLLIGAPRKRSPDAAAIEEHLDELARLADTAGAEVVGRVIQRLDAPTPTFFIGQGKVEAVKVEAEHAGATLVCFDDELSPVQGKKLEDALGLRVMDRPELILDIFATRARSKEAKMQVELAQLEYLLPRLTRMWNHLSRIRGGIGLRGPGETQLETDRRIIRRKIRSLKEKLSHVAAHRAVLRAGRREVYRAALIGYTNAGKSSLLRALTGADVFIEDRLFATLDTAAAETRLDGAGGGGRVVRFTDTVGFIRKLPHHLVASFRATLEEATDTDLLLHVVDGAHPAWAEQAEVVGEVLDALGLAARPVLYVLNKTDLLSAAEREARLREMAGRGWDVVPTSAVVPGGSDALTAAIGARLSEERPLVRVAVPPTSRKHRALALAYREGSVLSREVRDGQVVLTARLDPATVGRLRGLGAEVRPL